MSLSFSGCLVELFGRLLVVFNVLKAKKQREKEKLKINSNVFYRPADLSLRIPGVMLLLLMQFITWDLISFRFKDVFQCIQKSGEKW